MSAIGSPPQHARTGNGAHASSANASPPKRMAARYETLYKELNPSRPPQLAQAIPTAIPDTELTQLLARPQHRPKRQLSKAVSGLRTRKRRRQADLRDDHHGAGTDSSTRRRRSERYCRPGRRANRPARRTAFQPGPDRQRDGCRRCEKYRPYFLAKNDLETQQRIRETLMLRILQESVDAALPKDDRRDRRRTPPNRATSRFARIFR